jgi:hypothetical protein
VGCTTGSREEVPGERKPVIRLGEDDYADDNDDDAFRISRNTIYIETQRRDVSSWVWFLLATNATYQEMESNADFCVGPRSLILRKH